MTSTSTVFTINTPKIVQENIDGEVVIVNLEKGHYYSLLATSSYIWENIVKGLSIEEIIQEIVQKYEGKEQEIIESVEQFIEQLQQEEIIVKNLDSSLSQLSNLDSMATRSIKNKKIQFQLPKLEKYTDMEDLLVLDPIHDVDEMGWPNVQLEEA